MSDEKIDRQEAAVSDPQQIETLKEAEKEKLAAAEEAYKGRSEAANDGEGEMRAEASEAPLRRRRRSGKESGIPWAPGLILIGLGLIFLLNNVTDMHIDNWWAMFILIPAFGSFSKGFNTMRKEGELTREAWGGFFGGFLFSLVAAAFLFELDWSLIWPALLILGGLGLFFSGWKKW